MISVPIWIISVLVVLLATLNLAVHMFSVSWSDSHPAEAQAVGLLWVFGLQSSFWWRCKAEEFLTPHSMSAWRSSAFRGNTH